MYVITAYVVIVSYHLAKKSSSLIPVVPIAAMYYWSLFGVWSWIPMKLRGGSSYIETVLIPVNIDDIYFLSVLYYSIFIIIFATLECHMIKRWCKTRVNHQDLSDMYMGEIQKLSRNKWFNVFLLSILVCFVYTWLKDLSAAFSSGESAYKVSRWESSTGAGEYLSMFLGNLFFSLAIPMLFIPRHNKKRLLYAAMVLVYFGMNFLLGNRSSLLCALALGAIIFVELFGLRKLFRPRNIIIGFGFLLIIQFVSVVRGLSVNALLSGDFTFDLGAVFNSLTGSSEKDSAQVSMYATLKKDFPFTWGASVLFFISTFIPSFMGVPRPERVYSYYIDRVAPFGTDFGMTINHVTAWYINFGIIGIILGAIVWAYTLKFMFVRKIKYIYMYGAALFSAAAIPMIRDGGIECYKGCFILGTLIPMCVVWYFLRPKKMKLIKKS